MVGSFLYYGRAIDNIIITALNEIDSKQAHPTMHAKEKITMPLYYLATHSNAVLRYKSTDMCLHIDTDTAYIVSPGVKSCIAVCFYLGTNTSTSSPFDNILL